MNKNTAKDSAVAKNMVWIEGGKSTIGSDFHYLEERPEVEVKLDGFWMDPHPVTNRQFQEFVDATGYVTQAEMAPDASAYPEIPPEQLKAGSAVFIQPDSAAVVESTTVDLSDPLSWWKFVEGACWKNPLGRESDLEGKENHPVVHISFLDAIAYAEWAEKQIPTEREWEFAARGGILGAEFAWGNELEPGGQTMANIWKGTFPYENLKPDPPGTSPIFTYPPNGYGLFDMCGNVWEWTCDFYSAQKPDSRVGDSSANSCIGNSNASAKNAGTQNAETTGASQGQNKSRGQGDEENQDNEEKQAMSQRMSQRVIKGGSFLCSENYCTRYRPSARISETEDTSTNHLGFRCILRF